MSTRRPIVAVAGEAFARPGDESWTFAEGVGRGLVEAGCRVLTGGLGGVMTAALAGARAASKYREGDTVALLPGFDPDAANEFADIVLPTGLGPARNAIVAASDALVAVGGGAGTLSEVALGWQFRRPIVAWTGGGWSARLAGAPVDARDRRAAVDGDRVHPAATPSDAVRLVLDLIPRHLARLHGV